MESRKLWIALAVVLLASFAVLGGVGYRAVLSGPPIPARVVTTDGRALFDGRTIQDGQNVWQSIGGQEIGSIWGHGAYVAPDWSADWLHREATWLLDSWATEESGRPFEELGDWLAPYRKLWEARLDRFEAALKKKQAEKEKKK